MKMLEPFILTPEGAMEDETLEPGVYLKLVVRDTGEGMTERSLERIFDPFYTTKKQGEGTGMGLAVVHGIVAECGGSIKVESRPGMGSIFEILLPVIEDEPDTEKSDDAPLPMGRERILFVDDEPNIVDISIHMFKTMGYEVTGVHDSREALEVFSRSPDDFDLVITDMTMPHMTGDVLGQKILALRPNIPIIICTGFSEKLTDVNIRSLGFAGIAYKPLVIKELAKLVRQALDE